MHTSIQILVNLILLQFLSGFAWAVQRPQGFVVILFEQAGFSGSSIGLISALGLITPIVSGPFIGFVADRISFGKRNYLFAALSFLKACSQCAIWPAIRFAPARWTFWWTLVFTCIQAACSPGGMLTEITLRHVGKEAYGKVRLWGGIGFATGSLLTGLLAQWLRMSIGYNILFVENLAVGSAMSIIILCLSRSSSREQSLSVSLPLETVSSEGTAEEFRQGPERSQDSLHPRPRLGELMRFIVSPRVAVTLLIVVALGFGEGVMQTYTYVRLQHLKHGSSAVMGLSAVCMILSEIPFFYFANPIVQRCGIMPIMSLALLCAALRQAWIAWLWDAAWVLPGELLHGITFSIANAAVTLDDPWLKCHSCPTSGERSTSRNN